MATVIGPERPARTAATAARGSSGTRRIRGRGVAGTSSGRDIAGASNTTRCQLLTGRREINETP